MNKPNDSAQSIRQWWVKNIIYILLVGCVLFGASGTFDWTMAWIFLAAILLVVVANALVMDPSLLAERSQLQEGTKKWDVALASFVAVWGPLLIWLVAGLDHRFGWAQLSTSWALITGWFVFVLGSLITTWAMGANRYFASTVRIQTDRDHQVVTVGPYQWVRHPGYIGAIIAMLATSIALGSLIALIPAVLVGAGYVLRTSLEDGVLQKELPGYQEYAKRVRFRLLPLIW